MRPGAGNCVPRIVNGTDRNPADDFPRFRECVSGAFCIQYVCMHFGRLVLRQRQIPERGREPVRWKIRADWRRISLIECIGTVFATVSGIVEQRRVSLGEMGIVCLTRVNLFVIVTPKKVCIRTVMQIRSRAENRQSPIIAERIVSGFFLSWRSVKQACRIVTIYDAARSLFYREPPVWEPDCSG